MTPFGRLIEKIPIVRKVSTAVRTYSPKPGDEARKWYVIDAENVVLGRLASHAATLLRGKHKPTFAPHMDMGDFVVVINADKIVLTGSKMQQKMAHHHSNYPGGLTSRSYVDLMERYPTRAVEKAIRGMLPKNSIGRSMANKLKVYAGAEHPHGAQAPIKYEFNQISQVK